MPWQCRCNADCVHSAPPQRAAAESVGNLPRQRHSAPQRARTAWHKNSRRPGFCRRTEKPNRRTENGAPRISDFLAKAILIRCRKHAATLWNRYRKQAATFYAAISNRQRHFDSAAKTGCDTFDTKIRKWLRHFAPQSQTSCDTLVLRQKGSATLWKFRSMWLRHFEIISPPLLHYMEMSIYIEGTRKQGLER